jgi:hypothetical protein
MVYEMTLRFTNGAELPVKTTLLRGQGRGQID